MAAEILCMDLLNYSKEFFTINDSIHAPMVDFEKDINEARQKVTRFVSAVRNSGHQLICFIDKSSSTAETLNKWTARRMEEMDKGSRRVMASMSLLLGTLFQEMGVTVHYSTVDCDDTIAAFAYHMGGSVISRDCDFFRYYVHDYNGIPPYDVFFDFSLDYGRLTLKPHHGPGRYRQKATPRMISRSFPKTEPTPLFLDIKDLGGYHDSYFLQRGTGSNLTREENPHLRTRPLRAACYKRLGGIKKVMEVIPTWRDGQGIMTETTVNADGDKDYLLDKPAEAFQSIFRSDRNPGYDDLQWKNHVFCQKIAVAEVCAWASGRNILAILKEM